ncbi:MAG: hypothetical protein GXO65_02985 [Euryarchaeota archaeon]|nr:hypothetical protein [Euryarchaeota archaeon]
MLLEQLIIEILKTKDASVEEISTYTGLKPAVVKEVMERLVVLGIIEEGNQEFVYT